MNTKLKNVEVNPEYADLFSYKTNEEKIEHSAQMISYRILSEVEKVCDEKKINKKTLAEMVGTSRSYITQLFRGSKQVNTWIMARFEDALDISFDFRIRMDAETHEEFLNKLLTKDLINNKRFQSQGYVWYCYENKKTDDTKALVKKMEEEVKQKHQNSKQVG